MTRYAERLWPPVWLWVAAWLFVLSLALSFYVALGTLGAAVILITGGIVVSLGLSTSAAVVRVEDGNLTAGSARIPVSLLGEVEVLDPQRTRAVRGPESDPTGYHLIRGWVSTGVRVSVLDPNDRTPYWFVSSRRPSELAAAIEQARERQS